MKGRQTKEFKRILADRDARKRLIEMVSKGEAGGRVVVHEGGGGGEVTYNIRTSRTDDLARPGSSGGGGGGNVGGA